MCTEFFLAIVYFLTIFVVNYFLFELLKNYLKEIKSLIQLKTISENYRINDCFLLIYFYLLNKNKFKNPTFLYTLNNSSFVKDFSSHFVFHCLRKAIIKMILSLFTTSFNSL